MTKWYNALLSALLTMLGFESCGNVLHQEAPAEYGCPNVEYQVKGEVTDADSGEPIGGIQAKLAHSYISEQQEKPYAFDSVTTSQDGTFVFPIMTEVSLQPSLTVILEDSGDETSGRAYESDTIRLEDMTQKQVKKGDGRWFQGGYELTVNRQLKKLKGGKRQ